MYTLKCPIPQADLGLLSAITYTTHQDEGGLTYATFNSPEDLLLAQTILATHWYPVSGDRREHVDRDQAS